MVCTRFYVSVAFLASLACGCGIGTALLPWSDPAGQFGGDETPVRNPLMVPGVDREFLWNQAVDTVDNYFRIEHEERVKLIGGILTEGRIDTYPKVGSTLLEPWAGDSTPGYERLYATLQSVRRRAQLRVVPTAGGYLVFVTVHKEKEELAQPEHATVSGAASQHGEGPRSASAEQLLSGSAPMSTGQTLGWVPLGRDISLEQRMLRELRARLFDPSGPITVAGDDRP